jgi:hypothetical protein
VALGRSKLHQKIPTHRAFLAAATDVGGGGGALATEGGKGEGHSFAFFSSCGEVDPVGRMEFGAERWIRWVAWSLALRPIWRTGACGGRAADRGAGGVDRGGKEA